MQNILPEVMGVLKLCLDELTPETEEAWTRLIKCIANLVEQVQVDNAKEEAKAKHGKSLKPKH